MHSLYSQAVFFWHKVTNGTIWGACLHLGLQTQIGDQFLSGLHLPSPRLKHLPLQVGTRVGQGLPGSPGIFVVLPGTADSCGLETCGRTRTTGTIETGKFGRGCQLCVVPGSGSLLTEPNRAGLSALDDGD